MLHARAQKRAHITHRPYARACAGAGTAALPHTCLAQSLMPCSNRWWPKQARPTRLLLAWQAASSPSLFRLQGLMVRLIMGTPHTRSARRRPSWDLHAWETVMVHPSTMWATSAKGATRSWTWLTPAARRPPACPSSAPCSMCKQGLAEGFPGRRALMRGIAATPLTQASRRHASWRAKARR